MCFVLMRITIIFYYNLLSKSPIIFITDMNTAQIEAENTQMTNDLYRLLKKYTGLRNLIRELKVNLTIFYNL